MQWHELNTWVGNSVSLAAIIATIVGWLPPLAALAAIIWYAIQIHESKTIQKWLVARRARKIAVLQRRVQELRQQLKLGEGE